MSARRLRTSRSTIMFTNAVYFPNEALYQGHTPAQLNYSCINLVYYAYASVTLAGHVVLGDECADLSSPCDGVMGGLGSLMQLKTQHAYLQVILSVGGAGSGDIYAQIASHPVSRDNFAQSVYGLIEASGIDGIDINWTYPCGVEQGADLVALLQQVRLYLAEEHYTLAVSLPGDKEILQYLDLPLIAESADLINLAAYDMYGPWSAQSGHHAQLYATSGARDEPSAAASVQYVMSQGVEPKKILMGIPTYGRTFWGVSGPGQPLAPDAASPTDGTVSYCDLPLPGTRELVDKRSIAAYCTSADGFVSYDNPETVKEKGVFCRQKGIGGLFYSSTPQDSAERRRSLISAGFGALHSTAI